METPRRVVVARVSNRLQAEVLASELTRRGIAAEFEELEGAGRFGPHLSIVKVEEPQLELAREVVTGLTGRGAPRGALDVWRLLLAIVALATMFAAIVWIADLLA